MSDLPVVNDAAEWNARSVEHRHGKFPSFAFYSSVANAITTKPELMTVPIDDHAIVRGHAVFDTCTLIDGRLYRLNIHIRRLLDSAAAARIPLPFAGDADANGKRIAEIIARTCAVSGRCEFASIRYWLSAGYGNLSVTPSGCTSTFYCLVHTSLPFPKEWSTVGISEVTFSHARSFPLRNVRSLLFFTPLAPSGP
jgi:branched-subunit amino acid aminotransferase/4-amino-4-deoxychorismate lyase